MSFSEKFNNFIEFLKGIYYYFEDKWYNLLDKIDTKIPIYKIIDPIDKVIPSFVLFLLLVLFILVFLLYLIRFTSPYDVTFIVYDAETKSALSGVILSGTINDELFNEKTDSEGMSFVTVTSIKKNFFDVIGSIFFEDAPLLFGVISANKEGYRPVSKQELELSNKENKILLQKVPSEPIRPDKYTVGLVDSLTGDLIVDDSGKAYVKFRCENKNISNQPRKVMDIDDALVDGLFVLNEPDCAFIVAEASAPEYEAQGVAVTLPLNKTRQDIPLRKLNNSSEGIAKVGVYSSGPDGNTMLSKIRVEFHKGSIDDYAVTNNGGWAEKTLEEGTYNITISDENYYPVRAEANISINIKKGLTTTLMVKLVEINPADKRMVFFKVVDTDGNVLSNVKVDLLDLVIDKNGNHSGVTSNNSSYYYPGPPTVTDSNGLYKRTKFSVLSKNVFAILKKDGYLYKPHEPALVELTGTYETIVMEKATEDNSGKATVTVKSTNGKLLQKAKAFLYLNGTFSGINISNLKLNPDGILTNNSGMALYRELLPGTYSASAEFESNFSGITPTKDIDANQLVNFDVNIDVNAAFLKIELVSYKTGERITSAADVNISFVESSGLVLSEKLSQTSGFYTSKGYPRNTELMIAVKINNYLPRTIPVHSLSLGENLYSITMYSRDDSDCPTDEPDCGNTVGDSNISIFFDKVYAQNDRYWSGQTTAESIDAGSNYKIKFDVLVASPISYNQLFGMVRTSGPLEFVNSLPESQDYRKDQDLFDCDNSNLDNIYPLSSTVHSDNYYLPSECHNTNSEKIHAGYRWGDANIPEGVYSFITSFDVSEGDIDGERILFQYRAKEKNSTNTQGTSETPLKYEEFFVGQAIHNGVFFRIKLNNNQAVTVNAGNTNNFKKITFIPNEENVLSVQLQNNTNNYLGNGSIKIYSFSGNPSLNATFSNMKGKIFFDSALTVTEKSLVNSGLNVKALKKSGFFDTSAYTNTFNSDTWLVIVAQFGSEKYIGFVDARSAGKKLFLNAEFLAGAPDQIFDGEVTSYTSEIPLISQVVIEVYKDCKSTSPTKVGNNHELTAPSSNISENYFKERIEGIYEYMKDCVFVSVQANNSGNDYEPIIRQKIYAGSGGSLDTDLACVDIKITNGTQNASLEQEMNLYWNNQETFKIINNCINRAVEVSVNTGLVCNYSASTKDCSEIKTLGVGEEQLYAITGRNVDYIVGGPAPNFTDVLGYYPLTIKGRFSDKSKKKFSIVQRAHIHLSNPNQCFTISKDYFDFIGENTNQMDVVLRNECQYTLIGDYFIPSALLSAFGYDLNTNKTTYPPIVSFTPKVTITGASFVTSYIDVNMQAWGSEVKFDLDITKSIYLIDGNYINFSDINWDDTNLDLGNETVKYYGLSFDFSGETNIIEKLRFRFSDLNNEYYGIQSPYGATIDGNIIITYADGSVVSKKPNWNFDIDSNGRPSCIQQGIAIAGESCELNRGQNDFIYGAIYINQTPAKKINKIDLNIIASQLTDLLEIDITPRINFIEHQPITQLNSTTETVSYNLTSAPVSIPTNQGIIYKVKNIADINQLSQTAYTTINNPKIIITTDNPKVLAWINGSSLEATFVGEDYAPFNDGSIESVLVKTYGQGITYGAIDITDFVSTANAGSKVISGVQ